MSAFDDMAATLNGHDVTDGEGQVEEQTFTEEEATSETKTSDEDSATPEKAAEHQTKDTQSEDDDSENNFAEDDSGKRYVPEDRFKKVYGKMKELERQAKAQKPKPAQPTPQRLDPELERIATPSVEKADILELRMTLPQFDPKIDPETGEPTNPNYDSTLDELGYDIWRANPGISLVEAGRRAIQRARKLSSREIAFRQEARETKSSQSGQGITSRVSPRGGAIDPDSMSEADMEAYLKETGQW